MLWWLLILAFFPLPLHAAGPAAQEIPDYTLAVSFDPASSNMEGVASIAVKDREDVTLDASGLKIIAVTLDKKRLKISPCARAIRFRSPAAGILRIVYRGNFKPAASGAESGEYPQNVIGPGGISLTGNWYPRPPQPSRYHLKATLPAGFTAVSEAEAVEEEVKDGRITFSFSFPHPLEGINFIAGNYKIEKSRMGDVDIYAYFFYEDLPLARTYIDYAKKYLQLYERLLGKYAYKRFSIVENFLPTGFSMPTYTLLGREVVRLPFIVETSLGHEILHQWFGNLVYIDFAKGNWAEGLTTYLADHYYEEEKGRGWSYRKGALIDFQSYVNEKNDFPLKDFRSRTDNVSKAIGYGKALMVFHMLRNIVGEQAFYESLRDFVREKKFQKASWDDIRKIFEKQSSRDLKPFFAQWLNEKGIPDIVIEKVNVEPRGGAWEVAVAVGQTQKRFTVELPLTLRSIMGTDMRRFRIGGEKDELKLNIPGMPQKISLDGNYDIARRLSAAEFPPVISRLLGEQSLLVVLPPAQADTYEPVVNFFREKGAVIRNAVDLRYEDLRSASFLILGAGNPWGDRIFGGIPAKPGFRIIVRENPWTNGRIAAIIDAGSRAETEAAFPKVLHYGSYSELAFQQGKNLVKKTAGSDRGISREVVPGTSAVDVSKVESLGDVLTRLEGKKIVYVGESHTQYSHHLAELEIIQEVFRRGGKVAIGMEMFQRPFQAALDDYIGGRIDEREFLKRSEYFRRWRFDYNLYRPILEFARAKKIPVVALNMRQEIVEKVARGGLASLTPEEKGLLPRQMDLSDEAYRDRLKSVFQAHKNFSENAFDFFYEAQVLWDETMAETIDSFLKRNPDHRMVVLAGSGHLAYGSGIPQRAARRNGYPYAIILNGGDPEKGIADFVLYPPPAPFQGALKLMISAREERGRVFIDGFAHESAAEKAGLKTGDIILSIDNAPIHSVEDVRLELLFKKKGEKVDIRILRPDSVSGEREMRFEVMPQWPRPE